VRISDFSKTTTLGNWSADILVRSRSSVNPEADRNVRAGAGQNSSRAISHQGLAEVKGGRCDMWETPRASFIPAQGNALGSSAQNPISAESAIHPSSYQPPASHSASVPNVSFIELYEAGRWPATEYLLDDEPRALPWAGMKQAFGLSRGHPPGEHPWHRNPFFIREIREIRGSNCCNPWFQLLFLGLIPMKSQASTNSVLRSCPRSEKSKMRTTPISRPLCNCLRERFDLALRQQTKESL